MNANTTTSNNKEISLQREHDVWELRKRCWNQSDIAQHLGISQSAVSQILKRVRTRLAEQYFHAEAGQIFAEQIDQLMHIAKEALAAWEASKQQQSPPAEPMQEATPDQDLQSQPTPQRPTPKRTTFRHPLP